jgi:hypothetical protein
MWLCKCDCGREALVISQCLTRGFSRSCGCLRQEFLTLGPSTLKIPGKRPLEVNVTYPIPDPIYPGKSQLVNDVARRGYQFRWERVEHEARMIETGHWKEPKRTVFAPVDDSGHRILPIDLRAMAEEKSRAWRDELATPIEEVPASYCTPSSLLDLVRVVSDAEWGPH